MQDFPNDRGFAPINVETGRQHDQIWTTLQRHKRRHRRMNAERARFVITRGQNSPTLARAAYADRLSPQSRPVPHLDGRVKAVHIEMDDRASWGIACHTPM